VRLGELDIYHTSGTLGREGDANPSVAGWRERGEGENCDTLKEESVAGGRPWHAPKPIPTRASICWIGGEVGGREES
jgi:hypothetical protein